MSLPLAPPVLPQLARPAAELPSGGTWSYEPKYDGFRAVVFVDGDRVLVQSRNGRPLGRYFPELRFPALRLVLDGEIVVRGADGREDFNALQGRIHPAASRIALLARETPAVYLAFDLLARDDETLLDAPFTERRAALEGLAAAGLELTPLTRDPEAARVWLREAEGVIAKEDAAPYLPGERRGMVKVRRTRTLDCVVAGYRPGKAEGTVGSLILGLYDGGQLRIVGHSAGFTGREKRDLVGRLAPLETGQRGAGEPSRWSAGRELEWVELRPELVVEVSFDHVSGGRIRHGARVLRWREDKRPEGCRFDELA